MSINKLMDLNYVLNMEHFQTIQDSIAEATGMAIITVDYKGVPITDHSCRTGFCGMVRGNQAYSTLCEKCDSRGGLEAARLQKPYIYYCHCGVIDLAVPIVVEGRYLGAMMAGEVLLNDDRADLEHMAQVDNTEAQVNASPQLFALKKQLPRMSFDKVSKCADMMSHMINYIVELAVLTVKLNDLNDRILSLQNTAVGNEKLVETSRHSLPPPPIPTPMVLAEGYSHIILRPAIDYLKANYKSRIYLKSLAAISNVSPNYFSKLFKREMNCSLSVYINQLRIAEARRLLLESNISVGEISNMLGFEDSGYFIKVFKRETGETPAAFRKGEHLPPDDE